VELVGAREGSDAAVVEAGGPYGSDDASDAVMDRWRGRGRRGAAMACGWRRGTYLVRAQMLGSNRGSRSGCSNASAGASSGDDAVGGGEEERCADA
jgi:hypothetical protein